MTPNRRADRGYALGRRTKAIQFITAADEIRPDGSDLASHLAALLGLKTKAGYTHRPVSAQERTQAAAAPTPSSTPLGRCVSRDQESGHTAFARQKERRLIHELS